MRDRPALHLFLVSWLVLFLELACIRWFPSHVLFLTFFVNLVLLACFVGMSVGCLVARRQVDLIRYTPYWLLVGISGGLMIDGNTGILQAVFQVGNQVKPDVVYFGTETHVVHHNPLPFAIPMELVGAAFFAIIAGIMVGPGQEMGRAFNRVPDRTAAYTANLLGSLVGIGMFAGSSFLRLPPVVWFGLCGGVIAYLVVKRPNPPSPFPGKEGGGADSNVTGGPSTSPDADNRSPRLGSSNDAPPPSFPGKGDGGLGSSRLSLAALTIAVLLTVVTSGFFPVYGRNITWSEYYRVDYHAPKADDPYHRINTNLISQQMIEPVEDAPSTAVPYALPYLFQRELKKPDGTPAWPEFKRVLIIGAGNGNDVARALMLTNKDVQIDAVEIDPVIQKLGTEHHPNRPFQDKRVTVDINDGRNFLRKAQDNTYDLVVFALIDSLVLQSGYSNLRLESYLFTLESFQDVKRVLKPTGVYAVYNFLRLGWVASRIQDQLRTAFGGVEPLCIATPPYALVELNDFNPGLCVGFFAGSEEVVGPLRRKFAETGTNAKGEPAPMRFWYPWYTRVTADTQARFGFDPPPGLPPPARDQHLHKKYLIKYTKGPDGKLVSAPDLDEQGEHKTGPLEPEWLGLYTTQIRDHKGELRPATDNWPFVYTREPGVPGLTWRSVLLTLLLSVGLWLVFGGREALATEAGVKPDYGMMLRAFFLGAGFMLVETKAVTQMALLFGGTWLVNTAVFAAILVMSLLGNLFAGAIKPKRLEPYYVGLFAALAVGLAVSPSAFLGMGASMQIAGACVIAFLPIAFAGVIFATSFTRTAQPDRVFGANVAGALVGGLAENASVVLGFQLLLCVAVGFYVLSAAFGNRQLPDSAAENRV